MTIEPLILAPAPSAPGSATSEAAAARVENPVRARSHRRIMVALYEAGPLTREALAERLGMKESSLCARLSELRDLWITALPGHAVARSGCRVDAYALTDVGRARVQQAMQPLALEGIG